MKRLLVVVGVLFFSLCSQEIIQEHDENLFGSWTDEYETTVIYTFESDGLAKYLSNQDGEVNATWHTYYNRLLIASTNENLRLIYTISNDTLKLIDYDKALPSSSIYIKKRN